MSRRPPALQLDDPLRRAATEDASAPLADGATEAPVPSMPDGERAVREGSPEANATAELTPTAGGHAEVENAPGAPAGEPAQRRARRRRPSRAAAARADDRPGDPAAGIPPEAPAAGHESHPWRSWGRTTRTASYRLPDELLTELDDRARALGLPIGMTVAAGVLQLLDQDDAAVVAAVERAEDARLQGQRQARRDRSTRGEVAA